MIHSSLASIKIFLLLGFLFYQTISMASLASGDFVGGWSAYESRDYLEAARIWQPLAEQGHVAAQLNLGTLYDFGYGVESAPVIAARWYRAAAMQGNRAAQFNLAMMYATGRGLHQNADQAKHWYQKAAEQDLPIAQYRLGLIYKDSENIPTDYKKARYWLQKASEQGFPDAEYQLTNLKLESSAKANSMGSEYSGSNFSAAMQSNQAAFSSKTIETYFGTAWPIASGYVVTNNHVIAEGNSIWLITSEGKEIKASVVLRDEINDLAVLSVLDPHLLPPALPLSNKQGRLGMGVFTIGFPRVDVLGKTPKLSAGLISSENGLSDNPASYQISVPIQSGNSGGPLLDMHGEVVGVVASMLGVVDSVTGSTRTLPNIGYAIKINLVKELIKKLPQQQLVLKELPNSSKELELLAGRIKDSILIVKAQSL